MYMYELSLTFDCIIEKNNPNIILDYNIINNGLYKNNLLLKIKTDKSQLLNNKYLINLQEYLIYVKKSENYTSGVGVFCSFVY